MPTTQANVETKRGEVLEEAHYERWAHWPVHWSALWVGALAAITAVLLFGLIGIALGVSYVGPENRVVDLKKIALGTLAFSIFASFLSFVVGGWIAGKIAGILHAEHSMLHGAIVWLVAVPILVVLAGLGAGSYLGGWYSGLGGTPSWNTSGGAPFDRPEPLSADATTQEKEAYRLEVKQWKEDAPRVARNSALGALTALLLGLVGSVIGGWMASGEPMSVTYRRAETATKDGRLRHS